MSLSGRKQGDVSRKTVLTHLAVGRRRRILGILRDSGDPVEIETLAQEVVTAEAKSSTSDTTDTVDRARIQLCHVHLPALEDAGLVERTGTEVDVTNHPALREPAVIRLLERESEEWDAVIDCLAHQRRRHALAVLDGRGGPVPEAVLARDVAALEGDVGPSSEAVEEVRSSLYHVHLPKLQDAGLVEYDRDAGSVAYRGHPEPVVRWFHSRPCDPVSAGQPGIAY